MSGPMRRWIALILTLVLSVSIFVMPGFAAEDAPIPADAEETLPAATPAADVLLPEQLPVMPVLPEVTPEAAPTATPLPTEDPAPEATPAPTEEPAPDVTPVPDNTVSDEIVPGEESSETLLTPGESFTVSYYSGSALIHSETVAAGESPAEFPAANAAGTAISGWLNEDGNFVTPAKQTITGNIRYYAWYAPALESVKHDRYINGYGGGMFAPQEQMTRAQAATLLYNLLVSKDRGPYEVSFADVNTGDWYYEAVMTLSSHKVINGYGTGAFYPNDGVTRAEFVTMLVRIFGIDETAENTFSDVGQNSWAAPYVATAASRKWVNGYEDGTFQPDNSITRAEAVTIMNRALKRICDRDTVGSLDAVLYLDVPSNQWYYWEVMEASIPHSYTRTGDGETWTDYDLGDSAIQTGLQTIDGLMYYISSTTRQPVALTAGINKIDGGYYYAEQDGCVIDAVIDTEVLGEAGFKLVPGYNAVFYWEGEGKEIRHLTAGVNKINFGGTDYGYYADKDGYIINTSFSGPGVVELDGKLYISNGNSSIAISYVDYTGSAPVTRDLAKNTYEYNTCMYYVKEDYSLARDEWIEYLYFSETGRYTTGDATLDGYVYNVVKDIIANNKLTQEEKLLKVYYHFRGLASDGDPRKPSVSKYSYQNRGLGYVRQRYDWQQHINWLQSAAKYFFVNKKGACYEWAAGYLYCARRLGVQSYVVVGNLEKDRQPSELPRHCWTMIKLNGKWAISDVETEWGYLNRYYNPNASMYYNLFKQVVPRENVTYYENPERPAICYFFKDEG